MGAAECVCLTCLYVVALYLAGNPRQGRDNPVVIRRRALASLLVCSAAWLPVRLAYPADSWLGIALRLGLRRVGALRAAADAVGLCSCLFAGPLLMAHVDSLHGASMSLRSSAEWWRNIVVAPLTEEFFFRACMCPLLLKSGWSAAQVTVGCPLFFGLAHVHHVWELRRVRRMPWRSALLQVGCQVVYTTVFGSFATHLLLRTGHLAAPVAAHVFCNVQGLPRFGRLWHHEQRWFMRAALGTGIALFAALLPKV